MYANIMKLAGENEFWRTIAMLVGVLLTLLMLLPPLTDLVARALHAHSIAVSRLYQFIASGVSEYRKTFSEVMEETS